MPDPITSYAKGVVSDTFPIGAGDVVENSRRYSLSHLWEVSLRRFMAEKDIYTPPSPG